jgi:dTDP-4-amino-4,6-dideoxygalactose transaminase
MIPGNKPYLTGREIGYLADCISENTLSGDGKYSEKCAELMQEKFKANSVLLTPSCTQSLDLAAWAAGIGEGDEVIMPPHTFVSTANAFVIRGAKPVFVDIREDTLNIDENKIEEKITSRTKAIAPVHYAGVSAEMGKIMEIAKKHDLVIIEDAAQGVNATYEGKYLGTIGDFGCFSFHSTKNYVCGEGGAILTNNPSFLETVEIKREKGTNRKKFFRGEVDKYTWVDSGSNYLLSDIPASFLFAQLESMDEISGLRKVIHDKYLNDLGGLEGRIRLPHIPENVESNYHLFHFLAENEKQRDGLVDYLKNNDIRADSHFNIPLHLSPMGKSFGYSRGNFPVAENTASRLVRIPMFVEITPEQQTKVSDTIKEFYKKEASP